MPLVRRGGRLLGRPPTDSHIAPPANYRPQHFLMAVASDQLQQFRDGHIDESLVVVLGVVEVSSVTWFQNTPGPLRGDRQVQGLRSPQRPPILGDQGSPFVQGPPFLHLPIVRPLPLHVRHGMPARHCCAGRAWRAGSAWRRVMAEVVVPRHAFGEAGRAPPGAICGQPRV